MTIPEACRLVMEAATMTSGNQIFVFDMGKPIKIYDLAKSLIELSGLTLGKDIDIEITGLRPGEKLYEELSFDNEDVAGTDHSRIYVVGDARTYSPLTTVRTFPLSALVGIGITGDEPPDDMPSALTPPVA